MDEKSQIQALDWTQPLLPLRPGQVQRHSDDYKRHGTSPLFAALDVKTGRVLTRVGRSLLSTNFRYRTLDDAFGERPSTRRYSPLTFPLNDVGRGFKERGWSWDMVFIHNGLNARDRSLRCGRERSGL